MVFKRKSPAEKAEALKKKAEKALKEAKAAMAEAQMDEPEPLPEATPVDEARMTDPKDGGDVGNHPFFNSPYLTAFSPQLTQPVADAAIAGLLLAILDELKSLHEAMEGR